MTGLLERVKFLGGDGGSPNPDEPTVELPPLVEGYDRDPEPTAESRKPAARSAASSATASRQKRTGGKFVSNKQAIRDVADEIEMWLKTGAFAWSLSNEECGAVLNDTSAVIAADLAKLASRSDWVMERITTGGVIGDVVTLLIHAKPLIQVVMAHYGPAARRARAEEENEGYDSVTVGAPDPDRFPAWRPGNAAVA